MENSYKDENGRTWFNYIDADKVCTSFSEKQSGKTPCSAKDVDKTEQEIKDSSKNIKTGDKGLDLFNKANDIAKEKQQAIYTPETSKMPVWSWFVIGGVSLGVVVLIAYLGIKAGQKNKQ